MCQGNSMGGGGYGRQPSFGNPQQSFGNKMGYGSQPSSGMVTPGNRGGLGGPMSAPMAGMQSPNNFFPGFQRPAPTGRGPDGYDAIGDMGPIYDNTGGAQNMWKPQGRIQDPQFRGGLTLPQGTQTSDMGAAPGMGIGQIDPNASSPGSMSSQMGQMGPQDAYAQNMARFGGAMSRLGEGPQPFASANEYQAAQPPPPAPFNPGFMPQPFPGNAPMLGPNGQPTTSQGWWNQNPGWAK